MPIYTLTTSKRLSLSLKETLASEISRIHCETCDADPKYVNTRFIQLGPEDGFTAGKLNSDFLNLEGVIRTGRTPETEEKLLWRLNAMIVELIKPESYFVALGTFTKPYLIENGTLLPTV